MTEWFLGIVVWMGQTVLGMMPENQSETMVQNASGVVTILVQNAHGVSAWIPWGVISICFAFVTTFYLAAFTMKIIRQLIAHIPQFGGSG